MGRMPSIIVPIDSDDSSYFFYYILELKLRKHIRQYA